MPYIKQEKREKLDLAVENLRQALGENYDIGDVNYCASKLIWNLFEEKPNYSKANELVGVLECIKQEFVRRKVNPYEETKIKENGDLI